MKNPILIGIFCSVIGILVGVFSSEGIKRIIIGKKSLEAELATIKATPVKAMATTVGTPLNNVTMAHNYAVEFRKRAGYCNYTPPMQPPAPAPQIPIINIDGEGFMEISMDNAIDLIYTMSMINKKSRVRPISYRVINGLDDNATPATTDDKNILLVVGLYLDGSNHKKEILLNSSGESAIYKLDDVIDCPIKCDCNYSDIIVGGGTVTANACRPPISTVTPTAGAPSNTGKPSN
jgi:hypothetical protein